MKNKKTFLLLILLLPLLPVWYGYAGEVFQTEFYGEDKTLIVSTSALEERLIKLVNDERKRLNLKPFVVDPALIIVGRKHSEKMLTRDQVNFAGGNEQEMETLLLETGVTHSRRSFSIAGGVSIDNIFASFVENQNHVVFGPFFTHMGVGVIGSHRSGIWVTVICIQKVMEFDPFPKEVQSGVSYPLIGMLSPGFFHPMIKMTAPTGEIIDVKVYNSGGRFFNGHLKFDQGAGKYMVELLAEGTYGPTVAHLFPVYVDVVKKTEPYLPSYESDVNIDLQQLEYRLADLVNKDRVRSNLQPLVFDPALAAVARQHSSNMAQTGIFAHELPGYPALNERLLAAGIFNSRTGENIALDNSITHAEEELMESPAHRENILNPDFTHIGVGIIRKEDGLYITQNFIKKTNQISNYREASQEVVSLINEWRKENKLKPLEEEGTLTKIAQKATEKMLVEGKFANKYQLRKEFRRKGKKYHYFGLQQFLSDSLDITERSKFLKDADLTHIGVGVVQSEKVFSFEGKDILPGTILITLLLVEK